MITIHVGEQRDGTVFVLSPQDRHRCRGAGPTQVFLGGDTESVKAEVWASRWLLLASMLTGLSCSEVEAEGFRVLRYPFGEGDVIPVPPGTQYLRTE